MSYKNPTYQPMMDYHGPTHLIPTLDDWSSSFEADYTSHDGAGGFVEMMVYPDWNGPDTYKINIRGADDTMMMKVVYSKEELEALMRRLPSVVTFANLRGLGFKYD